MCPRYQTLSYLVIGRRTRELERGCKPGRRPWQRFGTRLALVPDEITIDWSTAQVQALPTARLQLHVHLNDPPDGVWHTAFSVAAAEHPASRSLDWGKASIEGTMLAVGDMVHSVDIEKMKAVLDETVADANERAKRARQAALDQAAEQKKRAEDVERLAQEMTDRLRGGASPST